MAKIVKSPSQVTPFAGINFIDKMLERSGVLELIDSQLGRRVKNSGYSYSDIFRTYWDIPFCGGEYAEDVQGHLRQTLKSMPKTATPSSDTLLKGLKELAVDDTVVESDSLRRYNFNINVPLNNLNLDMLLKTGQLKRGASYDFDYDNRVTEHGKWDAKRTYKGNTGYFPGVASIGDKVVWIENRDGNANVKLEQAATLERAYTALEGRGISVGRSRMDCGSYSQAVIETVSKHSKLFYVRAQRSDDFHERVSEIKGWRHVEINFRDVEVASLPFTRFLPEMGLRLVVQREKADTDQLDMFTGEKYIYRAILTNDHESTEEEASIYYNQRGGIEKQFDILNNDFLWSRLPFSDIRHNTVFMIVMAMAKSFCNIVIQHVSKVFRDIPPVARMRTLIVRFVAVAGKWVRRARQDVLVLYTDRPYELI